MSVTTTNGASGFDGILAIQKHDLAALMELQADLFEGMVDLAACWQKEMLQAVIDGTDAAAPFAAPPTDAGAGIALLFDTIGKASRASTARSNLLIQTMSLSGGKVSELLSGRWYAALDEWKAALVAAVSPSAAA